MSLSASVAHSTTPQPELLAAMQTLQMLNSFRTAGTFKKVCNDISTHDGFETPTERYAVLNTVKKNGAQHKELMVEVLEEPLDPKETQFTQHSVQLANGRKLHVAIAPIDSINQGSQIEFLLRRVQYLQKIISIVTVPGMAELIGLTVNQQSAMIQQVKPQMDKLAEMLKVAQREPAKADLKAINQQIADVTKSLQAVQQKSPTAVPVLQSIVKELGKISAIIATPTAQASTTANVSAMPPKVAATLNNGTPIMVQQRSASPTSQASVALNSNAIAPGAYASLTGHVAARFTSSLQATTTPTTTFAATVTAAQAVKASADASTPAIGQAAAGMTASVTTNVTFTPPAQTATEVQAPVTGVQAAAQAPAAAQTEVPQAPVAVQQAANTNVEPTKANEAPVVQNQPPIAPVAATQTVETRQEDNAQQPAATQNAAPVAPPAQAQADVTAAQATQQQTTPASSESNQQQQAAPASTEATQQQQQAEPEKRAEAPAAQTETKAADPVVETKAEAPRSDTPITEFKKDDSNTLKIEIPLLDGKQPEMQLAKADTVTFSSVGSDSGRASGLVAPADTKPTSVAALGGTEKATVIGITTAIGESSISVNLDKIFGDKEKVTAQFLDNMNECAKCGGGKCPGCSKGMSFGNQAGQINEAAFNKAFDRALANVPSPR